MADKGKRGFASMDQENQRRVATMGAIAAHRTRTAHEVTCEEGREAGGKGGRAAHQKGTAHRFTPEEAREAGRRGGQRTQGEDRFPDGPGAESAGEAMRAQAAESQAPR